MKTTLEIQRRLHSLGFYAGDCDGKSGPKTIAAVRAFQQAFGLVIDGMAGPQTRAALKQAATPVKPGKAEPDKTAMAQPVPAAQVLALGAAPPPNADRFKILDTARPIDEITWHCTATPEGKDYTVADIRAWHKARGFSDIGYQFVVSRDGTILIGRPIGQVGAHVAGHNEGSIGCSYIGGVSADGKTAKDTRTPAQIASMLWLTAQLRRKFARITKVTGHNQYANKACPSFDVRRDALSQIR